MLSTNKKALTMWRLRVIIESEAVIELGEINFDNVLIKVKKIVDENQNNVDNRFRHCDLLLLTQEKDINSAYAYLHEILNTFLDRLSVISYSKSSVKEIISITKNEVTYGEEFELALPQFMIERDVSSVTLSDLNLDNRIEKKQKKWERLFRLGLNTESHEEKYISYYSLLEEMAQFYSDEKVITQCTKCKKKTNTGRTATANFILNLFDDYNVDTKIKEKANLTRNKIAHGGGTKNKQFYADIMHLNSYLEEICILELEKRLGLNVLNRLNVHITDIPIVTHVGVYAKDGLVDLISSNQRIPARFINLKNNLINDNNQSSRVGIPLDNNGNPIIDPFAFPDLTT